MCDKTLFYVPCYHGAMRNLRPITSLIVVLICGFASAQQAPPSREAVLSVMHEATDFMVTSSESRGLRLVLHHGSGALRRLRARPSMIWVERGTLRGAGAAGGFSVRGRLLPQILKR